MVLYVEYEWWVLFEVIENEWFVVVNGCSCYFFYGFYDVFGWFVYVFDYICVVFIEFGW